jgi:hypothetical protein
VDYLVMGINDKDGYGAILNHVFMDLDQHVVIRPAITPLGVSLHDAMTGFVCFTVVCHITTLAHNNVQNMGFQGYSSTRPWNCFKIGPFKTCILQLSGPIE